MTGLCLWNVALVTPRVAGWGLQPQSGERRVPGWHAWAVGPADPAWPPSQQLTCWCTWRMTQWCPWPWRTCPRSLPMSCIRPSVRSCSSRMLPWMPLHSGLSPLCWVRLGSEKPRGKGWKGADQWGRKGQLLEPLAAIHQGKVGRVCVLELAVAFRTQSPERWPGSSAPASLFFVLEAEEGPSLPLSLSAAGACTSGVGAADREGGGACSPSTWSVPQPELAICKQSFTLSSWPSLVTQMKN